MSEQMKAVQKMQWMGLLKGQTMTSKKVLMKEAEMSALKVQLMVRMKASKKGQPMALTKKLMTVALMGALKLEVMVRMKVSKRG